MNHLSDFDKIEVELVLRSPANQEILQVLQKLADLEGVLSIERL
jgi:nitrate reductase NapAB chaperone NapD